jgi:hypothetical protein
MELVPRCRDTTLCFRASSTDLLASPGFQGVKSSKADPGVLDTAADRRSPELPAAPHGLAETFGQGGWHGPETVPHRPGTAGSFIPNALTLGLGKYMRRVMQPLSHPLRMATIASTSSRTVARSLFPAS